MALLQICLTQQPTVDIDTGCPNSGLGVQSYGTTIQFTSNFTTTYIGVSGDLNYEFAPNGDVYVDFLVMDACDGEVIFNTWNFTPCEVGQDLIFDSSPQPWQYDYWIELELPPADYILVIGAIGLENLQPDLQGCIDVTIISDLLGLDVKERIKKPNTKVLDAFLMYNLIGQKR